MTEYCSTQPIITDDGSTSFYSERFGDTYHSRHGAIQEARHVFIRHGLQALPQGKTVAAIFEMGFGTGLNALLTALEPTAGCLTYTTLECCPLSPENVGKINYSMMISDPRVGQWLEKMHRSPWVDPVDLSPHFMFRKLRADLTSWEPDQCFDLFYFDAFAPDVQPELWTEDIFIKLFGCANPGAILVTYSAKGSVRRALAAAGWNVERLPGPPGKREMLRGRKS